MCMTAFFFVTLCLPTLFNPVLVLASSLSMSPIPLDPLVENVRGWDNAWTETIFGNGTPPFKTIVYSGPQVTWNGTQWVKYEIKPVNETAVILRTPTCSYLVGKSVVSLFDPNGTLHVGEMEWIVGQHSVMLNKWVPKLVETASISYNSTHVWQKWIFSDGSERVLYIDHNNKQTVIFTSRTSATYRVEWLFTDVNVTRIIHSNGIEARLDKGSEISLTDFNFNRLTLYDKNKFSLLINFNDIERSYFRNFVSGHSETGSAYVNLIYGNWIINSNETITVDPTTQTFSSEGALDGTIQKFDIDIYPPTEMATSHSSMCVGQRHQGRFFWIYRGYVSFDTSAIQDYTVITSATLKLKTKDDYSTDDFTMRIMGGSQPIYNSSLEPADWNCGTTEVATWSSFEYPGYEIYVNFTIPTDQINVMGRTQFELKSDREGIQPSGLEYVVFCGGYYPAEDQPKLEITWLLPTIYIDGKMHIDGQWWYYWNSTTNEKAAIVLFGGEIVPPYGASDAVRVGSLFIQDEDGYKEQFVLDLHSNGFDVLSPKNDTQNLEKSYYNGTQDWVKDAAMWLKLNQSYEYVFLFGFSGGGVVAAYEIQKDYASIFSAAVIADAPVDHDPYGDIYNSAETASEAKVCTSFIVGEHDLHSLVGNITEQMENYYDNMVVHKEWHLWEDGHDPFPYKCLTHPDPPETVSDVAYNWYQHRHSLMVLAEENGTSLTNGDVYIDGQWRGQTGSNFPELGTCQVFVNDFWEAGQTGCRYGFDYWEDGSTSPNRTITIVGDTTITAYFVKKWCPGDVDGNGVVDKADVDIVDEAWGSVRGDPSWPNWDSRADLDCNEAIDCIDIAIVLNYRYSWITPTGHEDGAGWSNPTNTYDDNTATYAQCHQVSFSSYTNFLTLTYDAGVVSDGLRIWLSHGGGALLKVDLDIYRDGSWVHLFNDYWILHHEWNEWVTFEFAEGIVTKIRIRYQNWDYLSTPWFRWNEADFRTNTVYP